MHAATLWVALADAFDDVLIGEDLPNAVGGKANDAVLRHQKILSGQHAAQQICALAQKT